MEGHAVLHDFFQRKSELVEILISDQVAELAVNGAEIFQVDLKNLEWFMLLDEVIHLVKKAMSVIQFRQSMYTVPLAHECHKQNRISKCKQNRVHHDLRKKSLDNDTNRNDRKHIDQRPAQRLTGRVPVSKITYKDKNHLHQCNKVA